jgi:putative two-component system response regulator
MLHHRKVILVIEDSPTQATLTSALLEDAGVTVLCAINGQMGIRLAGQVHPDLILLDINMPDVDGFEVCSRLKQNEETADIPIIILSRQPQNENQVKSLALGAIEFIPKDAFANRVLVETLRQMGILDDSRPLPSWSLP